MKRGNYFENRIQGGKESGKIKGKIKLFTIGHVYCPNDNQIWTERVLYI